MLTPQQEVLFVSAPGAAEESEISSVRERCPGGNRAADSAAEVVGLSVPIGGNAIFAEQGVGNIAGARSCASRIERAERDRPSRSTAFRPKQKMWEAAKLPERNQPLERQDLRFRVFEIANVAMKKDGTAEQASAANLELNAMMAVIDEDLLQLTAQT